MMKARWARGGIGVLAVSLVWLAGCRTGARSAPDLAPPATPVPAAEDRPSAAAPSTARRAGYSIQVGAFSVEENARSMAADLVSRGLDAFYVPAPSGLYKVRFGDFASREDADREARRLVAAGRLDGYFVVGPEFRAVRSPAPATSTTRPAGGLREKLVGMARSFIGTNYVWGGTTSRDGFDCSGLVRAVYRLNGVDMPRSVADQYRAGKAVPRERLLEGDLVFFSASPDGALSHVGIYVGRDSFIHAPGKGKRVRQASLDSGYFKKRFCGARAYVEER